MTFTDNKIRELFARHCECRPLNTARISHRPDCDTGITDDCRTALHGFVLEDEQWPVVVSAEARELARGRCAERWGALGAPSTRDLTGLPPLDHVLGGGLVKAAVVLLVSPPDIGGSSLTLQMLGGLHHRCLYVTVDETLEQIAATARGLGIASPRLYVMAARSLAQIFEHACSIRAQTIAIDSIQKLMQGSVGPCVDSMGVEFKEGFAQLAQYARTSKTALWLISEGEDAANSAGLKAIETAVDVVLELSQGVEFAGNERILSCPRKNRFGAINVTGRFELTAQGFVPMGTPRLGGFLPRDKQEPTKENRSYERRDRKLITLLDAARELVEASSFGPRLREHALDALRAAAVDWAADECPACGRRGDHAWDELTDTQRLAHEAEAAAQGV